MRLPGPDHKGDWVTPLATLSTDAQTFLDTWTHGVHGLVAYYLYVGVFVFAGLMRGKARFSQLLRWPLLTVPTLLIVGLSIQLTLWVLERFAGVSISPAGELWFAVLAAAFGGYAGGHYWAARTWGPVSGQTRGAVVRDGLLVQRHGPDRPRTRREGSAPDPITVAGVAVPASDETKHFKFMGTTGSGKSTAMREVLAKALKRGDRAVIADPDGGYLSRFYDPARGDVILNPFDARTAQWDLFGELRTAYDVDELARALIPDRGGDPQWTGYARTFFASVLRQAKAAELHDLAEVYRLLTSAPKDELKVILSGTPAAPFLEDGSEKLFGGVRSTTADAVRCLDYLQGSPGTPFSVRDWVRSGTGVLFLPYQAEQISALKAVIATWMRLAIFQALSLGEGDCRLWFSIDEIDALGTIDGLPDALARLRKVGGRCLLGFQTVGMITTLYGQGPGQAIVENAGNTLILRCSAADGGGTARFASRLIGEREIIRTTNSVSRSPGRFLQPDHVTDTTSEQYATEAAVLTAEIEQLPDREGFLKLASQAPWWRVGFPVFDVPKRTAAYVERR